MSGACVDWQKGVMTEMVEITTGCMLAQIHSVINLSFLLRFSCHVIEVSSSLYLKFWRTDTLKVAVVTRHAVVTASPEAKRARS